MDRQASPSLPAAAAAAAASRPGRVRFTAATTALPIVMFKPQMLLLSMSPGWLLVVRLLLPTTSGRAAASTTASDSDSDSTKVEVGDIPTRKSVV